MQASAQGLYKCKDAAGKITYAGSECQLLGLTPAGEVTGRASVAPALKFQPRPPAAPADEPMIRGLGADVVVPRGAEVCAAAIREAFPDGVDAVIDAALLGPPILAAVRDGGQLIAVRPFAGESERDIEVKLILVGEVASNQAGLRELAERAGSGELTTRVADAYRPEQAAEAYRRLEAGGVRGRLLFVF